MIKIHRILAVTTLLVVFGFMMIVWAKGGPHATTDARQYRFGKGCATFDSPSRVVTQPT